MRSFALGRVRENCSTHRPLEARKLKSTNRQFAKCAPGVAQAIALAIALALCIALTGCGNAPIVASVTAPVVLTDCGDESEESIARDLIQLDWTGGVSSIYPDEDLPSFDLSLFATPDGTLLEDRKSVV